MPHTTVENVQEIIRLAVARAIAEITQSGGLFMATGPEDAVLADAVLVDGEYYGICLFDDAATGFDNEEAGFN